MFLTTALICMAANIYFEARGEPLAGQIAVAQVTMNRAKGDPAQVCAVVLKSKQFSWTISRVDRAGRLKAWAKPKDAKAWDTAKLMARMVLRGWVPDITKGATHYHERKINPRWSRAMPLVAVYGAHVFYRGH